MTTMQLECFLAVAETLNFAKAAGQLNVTQPAVTQQIHSLEEELNVQLFKRTTRMVQMTPEAYAFLDDARHILHLIHFTKRRFREQGSEGRMPFNIGSHAHNDLDLLTDVLRSMAEIYPAMLPVFQVVPFQHLYKLLAEETVDVVVAFQTKDEKESYGRYKEFIKVPLVGVVPAEHPLAEYDCLTAEDLERQRLVFIAPPKCPGGLRAFQHDLIKDRAPADMIFCEDPGAALLLAKSGFGIAMLPKFPGQNDARLKYIPLSGVEPLSFGAYYKSTSGRPMLREFLRLCREYLSEELEERRSL